MQYYFEITENITKEVKKIKLEMAGPHTIIGKKKQHTPIPPRFGHFNEKERRAGHWEHRDAQYRKS